MRHKFGRGFFSYFLLIHPVRREVDLLRDITGRLLHWSDHANRMPPRVTGFAYRIVGVTLSFMRRQLPVFHERLPEKPILVLRG